MQLKWTERISLTQSGVNRIKAVAGVYRLINYSRADDKYYVYYVGQADDLNNRLSQHLSGNETNECCQKYLNNYTCYFRAAGRSVQNSQSGFSSKKVRISFSKRHQNGVGASCTDGSSILPESTASNAVSV